MVKCAFIGCRTVYGVRDNAHEIKLFDSYVLTTVPGPDAVTFHFCPAPGTVEKRLAVILSKISDPVRRQAVEALADQLRTRSIGCRQQHNDLLAEIETIKDNAIEYDPLLERHLINPDRLGELRWPRFSYRFALKYRTERAVSTRLLMDQDALLAPKEEDS